MSSERPHGSAVGIPGPPGPTSPPPGAGRHGIASQRPAGRRRARRWLWLLALPIAAAAMVAANRGSDSDSSAIDHLDVGDCFDAPDSELFTGSNIDEVSCDQPHEHEVYAVGTTTAEIGTSVGADDNPEIVRICRTDVAPGVLAALARTAGVTPGVIVNRSKPGRVVCTANTTERTGSLIDSAVAP